jgi:hypothetical protein
MITKRRRMGKRVRDRRGDAEDERSEYGPECTEETEWARRQRWVGTW